MSLVLTVTNHWSDTKRIHVVGTLAPSGNYVTNGDTITYTGEDIKSPSAPIWAECLIPGGFIGVFTFTGPGAGKLKIFNLATGAELAQTSYAGFGIASIAVYAIFPKFI